MLKQQAKDKIGMALDGIKGVVEEKKNNLRKRLEFFQNYVGWVKIGNALFTSLGPESIKIAKEYDYKIFLDLKFHDIPNTVKESVFEATLHGVDMLNLHCLGTSEMMKAAVEGAKEASEMYNIPKPLIIGVTILTSITEKTLNKVIGIPGVLNNNVLRLAHMANNSKLDGVVCSPLELKFLANPKISGIPEDFMSVTPGIRPKWAAKNEQKRVTTPYDAILGGADLIVVGRPLYDYKDIEKKKEAATAILNEVREALVIKDLIDNI